MPIASTYPDYFARFYDVIYANIRTGTDKHYFLEQIIKSKGPVLEVGVGTGRFFKEALDKGVDIYGIDNSESMLEVLKGNIPEDIHHRVTHMDINEMKLDKKFDLIIAPFRVFSHLVEIDEQLIALDKIYEHLEPGGKFIFDLFIPDLDLLQKGLDKLVDFEGEYEPGKKLRRITSMNADLVKQISNVTMKFVWDEDRGEQIREWNLKLRFFFRYELEHLIARSKLNLEHIYGDFSEGELMPDSKDFVVVTARGLTH